MGISRDTFYRYRELADEGGIDALVNRNRRVPNFKNRIDEIIERAVVEYAIAFPTHDQYRRSNELQKKGGFISGTAVRSVWLRHDLKNFKKRLKALEEKVARESIESPDRSIGAKAHDDEACSGENSSSWVARHLLYGQTERSRSYLAADLYRHVLKGRLLQAI